MERTHGPTNRNRIQGAGDRGEWARDHEAPVTKGIWRKSGGRVGTVSVLTRGDLALGLKGPRGSRPRSEKSAEAIRAAQSSEGPNGRKGESARESRHRHGPEIQTTGAAAGG